METDLESLINGLDFLIRSLGGMEVAWKTVVDNLLSIGGIIWEPHTEGTLIVNKISHKKVAMKWSTLVKEVDGHRKVAGVATLEVVTLEKGYWAVYCVDEPCVAPRSSSKQPCASLGEQTREASQTWQHTSQSRHWWLWSA